MDIQKSTFLSDILDKKKKAVDQLYDDKGLEKLRSFCKTFQRSVLSFQQALSRPGLNLIGELKKASPSKGIIRKEFDPTVLAEEFKNSRAAALSVVTEPYFFKGSPEFLRQVRIKTQLPILRKDFIIDPIQIYESYAIGADAILLIKSILSSSDCQKYLDLASELNMAALVEVHDRDELEEIKQLRDIQFIGINNRDLTTFEMDMNRATDLNDIIKKWNKPWLVVAESGYSRSDELEKLASAGFNAVLIGEGLAQNPKLLEWFRK